MSIPDPKFVISLARELDEARERYKELELKWNRLFVPQEATNKRNEPNLQDRIIELLEAQPRKSFGAPEAAEALSANASSVSSILSRLVNEKKIEKRGRGLYGSVSGASLYLESSQNNEGSVDQEWHTEPKEGVA